LIIGKKEKYVQTLQILSFACLLCVANSFHLLLNFQKKSTQVFVITNTLRSVQI